MKMNRIGGNTTATISVLATTTSAIGEQVKSWTNVMTLKGWLDLSNGDTKTSSYDARIQESTHVFLCDHVTIPSNVTSETARMTIDGKHYTITLIDDPMNLHEHMEIFLKYTGGQ